MSGPTPGPWTISGNMIVARNHGWEGAIVCREVMAKDLKSNTHDTLTAEANARLIASAPELLAALEQALAASYDTDEGSEEYPNQAREKWVEQARAAVRKARGESE